MAALSLGCQRLADLINKDPELLAKFCDHQCNQNACIEDYLEDQQWDNPCIFVSLTSDLQIELDLLGTECVEGKVYITDDEGVRKHVPEYPGQEE